MKKEYPLIIEQDEMGYYVGTVPGIKNCYTQAKSLDELLVRIKEVLTLCLEVESEENTGLNFIGMQKLEMEV